MLEVSADALGSCHSFSTHLPAANLEARGGIEPPIKVLQTFALPLGDRASDTGLILPDNSPGIVVPAAANDAGSRP